ncbi:kinase-like domain-containing protein [Mucor mucedo]|uniref:kinase-like domain-containing protein n=1 Tax=Mucor mucedo TaxID=29922 RepID=UPI00221EC2A8|nr:kinase-like domain-containing protein [Mucor mucedo]KAI7889515.1 kinase-like domain-containing protein [Mucor mucedo]
MLSSPRNSVTHNQQAKLAVDYNELLKELSSHEMTSVGCYTIGETIGEGTFGKVKKGFHKLTGRLVAIKKISKQHAPMMAREIHHHRQLKHPNIVMLYEMITTESCIHIISEYCPNGDLLDALTDSGRCSEIRVHKWFRQLTDAINYCHTRGIVHRDLKLENILLDAEDNVKICDFGFARFTQKNQYLETFCGSLSYSAPEVILRKKYTGPETDIWSLGVILYTLLAGEYPFDDDSEIMTQRKIVQVDYQMPFYFAADLSDLISHMLQLDPAQRITIDNIIDHPWMHSHEIEEETCLTPSSSTTTNTSDMDSVSSFPDEDPLFLPHDLKFSPQVRSSLGILRPSQHQQQQQQQQKSPRFSAPLNRRTPNPFQNSYRSSLPSSFQQTRDDVSYMSPIEQRLFAALTAAGFDKDALIKMQTGECDTSSTLWHLLLENMSTTDPSMPSVPDALASALQSRQEKHPIDVGIQTGVEEQVQTTSVQTAVQTTPVVQPVAMEPITTTTKFDYDTAPKPYPRPATTQRPIQTVGFGSTSMNGEKSGWFTSVKSWFGSKQQQQQQQLQMMQQQNELILKHQERQRQGRPLSQCSSPVASPSSYREFDTSQKEQDGMMMTPPIYRTGSQKYRRRVLQLSQPAVSELDQLTYNGTTLNHQQQQQQQQQHIQQQQQQQQQVYQTPQPPLNLHAVNMPPTALTTRSLVADSFSILNASCQPKEIDMCEKRYSMYRPAPQATPPPSPPAIQEEEEQVILEEKVLTPLPSTDDLIKNNLSDFSSDSSDCSSMSDSEEEPTTTTTTTTTTDNSSSSAPSLARPRSNRFEFAPRSRLSVYGMQEPRGMSSKTIIEEEEEEEDEF